MYNFPNIVKCLYSKTEIILIYETKHLVKIIYYYYFNIFLNKFVKFYFKNLFYNNNIINIRNKTSSCIIFIEVYLSIR